MSYFMQQQQYNQINQLNHGPTYDSLQKLSKQYNKGKNKFQAESQSISTNCDSCSDSEGQNNSPLKMTQCENQNFNFNQNNAQQQQKSQSKQKKVLSPNELQALQQQQNYKTEICRNWKQNGGVCQYGSKCRYAHGEDELNQKSNVSEFFKTRECKLFHQQGYCSYGIRCHFIHVNKSVQKKSEISQYNLLQAGLINDESQTKNTTSRFDFAQQELNDNDEVINQQPENVDNINKSSVLSQLQIPANVYATKNAQSGKKLKKLKKNAQIFTKQQDSFQLSQQFNQQQNNQLFCCA